MAEKTWFEKTKLFLDDYRMPPDSTWNVVRSYDAFVEYVTQNGVPDVISFDHDLGYISPDGDAMFDLNGKEINPADWTEKTGYDCATWLMEHHHAPAEAYVHSMNPIGAKRIRDLFYKG